MSNTRPTLCLESQPVCHAYRKILVPRIDTNKTFDTLIAILVESMTFLFFLVLSAFRIYDLILLN